MSGTPYVRIDLTYVAGAGEATMTGTTTSSRARRRFSVQCRASEAFSFRCLDSTSNLGGCGIACGVALSATPLKLLSSVFNFEYNYFVLRTLVS